MGKVSINLSLAEIYRSWYLFRKGKRITRELDKFQYDLEKNLFELWNDLNNRNYQHGGYKEFIVYDSKKRKISVAEIRDRVIHRLVYEFLVPIYNKTFDYDIWSCRKGKGLLGAIERTQLLLKKFPRSFVWRADIRKFFDNVDHRILKEILIRKIEDQKALRIINKIIDSYSVDSCVCVCVSCPRRGIPIGNLTSQIFSNIYLNELDRFVRNSLKPQAYLRYGDDFVIIDKDRMKLAESRSKSIKFLDISLTLNIKKTNEVIVKAKQGLKFLGVEIYPVGRRLNHHNQIKISQKLEFKNISSYAGLIKKHQNQKAINKFNWQIMEILEELI